jgi:hypothetical protein
MALKAAHAEATSKSDKPVDSTGWPSNVKTVGFVTQTGTVTDSNTGHECLSGHELLIKIIGTYDNVSDGRHGR